MGNIQSLKEREIDVSDEFCQLIVRKIDRRYKFRERRDFGEQVLREVNGFDHRKFCNGFDLIRAHVDCLENWEREQRFWKFCEFAIAGRYLNDAFNSYQFGKYAEASELFAKSADAAASAPLNKVDTTALYNAGFTAWMVQDYNRAQNFFEKCLANNYYYEGGEVFAKLGDVYAKLGDKEKGRDILEQGFTKFPQSQSILIGLINYYMESGQNTDRLFSLINEAKKNEPDNASLYYVEGNIYKELGQNDNAIASYYKCADINPNYEFGYIGAGILYYNLALEYQEKAQNELDDKKYEALVEQFNASLKSALDPFEKAYNLSKDNELRVNVAEYLKNIYYRFSSDSDEFMAGYKKYDEVVKTGQAK